MRDTSLDEPTEKTYKRLRREARIWARLPPNQYIAEFLGYFVEERQENIYASLVSRWYPNGHVEKFLSMHPEADREALCGGVACALMYLHENIPPIVHGDLKPNNVLVDDTGQAVLCDFGMSIALDRNPTGFTSSIVGGAIRFLSYELLDSESASRTLEGDIYAFGCICLSLLYKRYPYHGKPDRAMFAAIDRGEPPHTFTIHDPTPQTRADPLELRRLMQQCWDHDPARRPNASHVCLVFAGFMMSLKTSITILMRQDETATWSGYLAIRWLDQKSLDRLPLYSSDLFLDALYCAAQDASLGMIALLLSRGTPITPIEAGEALYCLLTESGSRPERDGDRVTILHLLVKAGADLQRPRCRKKDRFKGKLKLPGHDPTPLHGFISDRMLLLSIALHCLNIPLVTAILDLGVDISSDNEQNPLVVAADQSGCEPMVELLLNRGVPVNGPFGPPRTSTYYFSSKSHHSALSVAVHHDNITLTQTLIAAGADINSPSSSTPPLYWAAYQGGVKMAQLLLNHNADVNFGGATKMHIPLFSALQAGHGGVTTLLLNSGAKPSQTDGWGCHAAFYATNVSDLDLLLAYEPSLDLNRRDHLQDTPLHAAAKSGRSAVVMRLLEFGASATMRGNRGSSVLHSLCEGYERRPAPGDEDFIFTIRKLISLGVSVDWLDNRGKIALRYLLRSKAPKDAIDILALRPERQPM